MIPQCSSTAHRTSVSVLIRLTRTHGDFFIAPKRHMPSNIDTIASSQWSAKDTPELHPHDAGKSSPSPVCTIPYEWVSAGDRATLQDAENASYIKLLTLVLPTIPTIQSTKLKSPWLLSKGNTPIWTIPAEMLLLRRRSKEPCKMSQSIQRRK